MWVLDTSLMPYGRDTVTQNVVMQVGNITSMIEGRERGMCFLRWEMMREVGNLGLGLQGMLVLVSGFEARAERLILAVPRERTAS